LTRTLGKYLGKDLAKATLLATLAFTVVLTVLAIIEPLRSRGLSGNQAVALFVYLLPFILSLTLPVAALFAATIVYGRFAQDNELMACRASGICTLTLMKPAMILAAIVCISTLTLGLYIAPELLRASESGIKNRLEDIAYHQLKSRGHVNITDESQLFHADEVNYDSKQVYGVVLVKYDHKGTAEILVASSASLEFVTNGDETAVVFEFVVPKAFRQDGGSLGSEAFQRFTVLKLGGIPDDKPRFYGWKELWDTWRNPSGNRFIRRRSGEIRREAAVGVFLQDVAETIKTTGHYDRMVELTSDISKTPPKRLQIFAPDAWMDKGVLRLGRPGTTTGPKRPVIVREMRDGRVLRQLEAASASLEGGWGKHETQASLGLKLVDVNVRSGTLVEQTHHKEDDRLGPLALPGEAMAKVKDLDLQDVAWNPAKHNVTSEVVGDAQKLFGNPAVPKQMDKCERSRLLSKVRAEIHLRLSYGTSCLLTVLLGAALGLLWRGGQVLAAFTISAVPGAAVAAVVMMGREFIKSPTISDVAGMGVTWGGIALLGVVTGFIYLHVLRR